MAAIADNAGQPQHKGRTDAPAAATPVTPATPVSPGLPTPPPLSPPPQQDIANLLTIILTTSPTPSAPATDLVAAVLASFRAYCPALLACPVIAVFDTYDHVGRQLRLKKGCVTPVEAANYDAYKANVKELVSRTWSVDGDDKSSTTETGQAEYGSPCIADNAVPFSITRIAGGRIAFIEPAVRLGFGLAVRTAVRVATTPYVWVQQHDWTLAAEIPLAAMLDAMRKAEQALGDGMVEDGSTIETEALETESQTPEKGDTSPSELEFDIATSTNTPLSSLSSSSSSTLLSSLDSRAPVAIRYICLPSVRMLRYAVSAHAIGFPTLRALTAAFKRDVPTSSTSSSSSTVSPDLSFFASGSISTFDSGSGGSPSSGSASGFASSGPGVRLPLTPLFFWHDKTHIASRDHYLRRVFPTRLALGRGDFIEDHIGQRARFQMKHDPAAWHRWACWLYYPDHGRQLCLRHLQGRTWRGEEQEQAIRDLHVGRNRSAASAAAAMAVAAGLAAQSLEGGPKDKRETETSGERSSTAGINSEKGWETMPFGPSDDSVDDG